MRLSLVATISFVATVVLLFNVLFISEYNPDMVNDASVVVGLMKHSYVFDKVINDWYKASDTLNISNTTILKDTLLRPTNLPTNVTNGNTSVDYENFGVAFDTLTTSANLYFFNVFSAIKKALGFLLTFVSAPALLVSFYNPPLVVSLLFGGVWFLMWFLAILNFIRGGVF